MNLFAMMLILYMCILLLLIYVAYDETRKKKAYIPVKLLCSGLFMFLITEKAMHSKELSLLFFLLITGPFLLYFLGDLFMGLYHVKRKKRFLFSGIIVFLLGHCLILLLFFLAMPKLELLLSILALLFIPGALWLMNKSNLHLGKVRPFAMVYSYFVGLLFLSTMAIDLTVSHKPGLLALAGTLFASSDLLLLYLYFFHFRNRKMEKRIHIINLITYYMAILCFILAV